MQTLPEECVVHALGFLELEDVIDFTRTTEDASAGGVAKHDKSLFCARAAAGGTGARASGAVKTKDLLSTSAASWRWTTYPGGTATSTSAPT